MKIKSLLLTLCFLFSPTSLPAGITNAQGYTATAVIAALAITLGISDTQLRHSIASGTFRKLMKERGGFFGRKNWRGQLATYLAATAVGTGVSTKVWAKKAAAQNKAPAIRATTPAIKGEPNDTRDSKSSSNSGIEDAEVVWLREAVDCAQEITTTSGTIDDTKENNDFIDALFKVLPEQDQSGLKALAQDVKTFSAQQLLKLLIQDYKNKLQGSPLINAINGLIKEKTLLSEIQKLFWERFNTEMHQPRMPDGSLTDNQTASGNLLISLLVVTKKINPSQTIPGNLWWVISWHQANTNTPPYNLLFTTDRLNDAITTTDAYWHLWKSLEAATSQEDAVGIIAKSIKRSAEDVKTVFTVVPMTDFNNFARCLYFFNSFLAEAKRIQQPKAETDTAPIESDPVQALWEMKNQVPPLFNSQSADDAIETLQSAGLLVGIDSMALGSMILMATEDAKKSSAPDPLANPENFRDFIRNAKIDTRHE